MQAETNYTQLVNSLNNLLQLFLFAKQTDGTSEVDHVQYWA